MTGAWAVLCPVWAQDVLPDDTIVEGGEPQVVETETPPKPAEQAANPTPQPASPQPASPQPESPQPESSQSAAPQPAASADFVSDEEEAVLREALGKQASPPTPLPVEPDQHVVSQSRMFSVSGGDSLRMGAIASRADEVFNRVCKLLGFETTWKYAISIRLLGSHDDPPRLNPIRKRIRIIGNTPNFQIRIYPGGGIDLQSLDNSIVSMVLYERVLRDLEVAAYPDEINLPDWLVTGVQQAVMWKNGKVDRQLYRNLFERAEMMSPEEIISMENPQQLDATTRQVFDVSCGVLVMSLLDSPGGPVQMRALLTEGALEEGTPREMVTRYFHELGVDENMFDKWWALELAALALPRASEALTPLESEERLVEALTIVYFDDELNMARSVSLDNVYRLRELPDWEHRLQPCIERLVALSATCFPGYRPIVTEYCRVLGDMMSGTDSVHLQESLGPLRELRRAYVSACIRGRDYLDWYEITHLGHTNMRSFDSYLTAMELLRRESPGVATPMSEYLEDIEALFEQKEGEPLPSRLQERIAAATTPPEEDEEADDDDSEEEGSDEE